MTLCQIFGLYIYSARHLFDFIFFLNIFGCSGYVLKKGDSRTMTKSRYLKYTSLNTIAIIFFIFISSGCAQVEQIPGQVHEDLPNPVSDFTERDTFMIGLKWYQQGSFDIARKFWKPLSQEGDCDAEYAMGLLYYAGAGVRRSYGDALMLWTEAAEQGQTQAQIALGAAYSHRGISYASINCKKGCGVEKNLIIGYKWFGLGGKSGSVREAGIAQKSIEAISTQMTSEQIEEAQSKIKNWKPTPSECKSRGIIIAAPSATRVFY